MTRNVIKKLVEVYNVDFSLKFWKSFIKSQDMSHLNNY